MIFSKIFQNRNLTLLWLGQMISQSGDSIYQIGLLWLVLELSGSKSATGLVAMSSYLPAVLLSLFAGVTADRYDRRRIMLLSDGARFLIVLIIPTAFLFGILNPISLGINAFVLAIAATFFNPARDSFIPQIIPKEGLLKANSLIQTSWQFALLLGPAIAGVLLHYLGNIQLFTACAFSYLISFAFIFLIRPHASTESNKKHPPGLSEIKDGLLYAIKHRVI
ncbi:MAG: MFS transporter, partial [candidate division Zixibacteria bacterium]|nr:MFS transporter [candidate division Zixibacteria bacterium]